MNQQDRLNERFNTGQLTVAAYERSLLSLGDQAERVGQRLSDLQAFQQDQQKAGGGPSCGAADFH